MNINPSVKFFLILAAIIVVIAAGTFLYVRNKKSPASSVLPALSSVMSEPAGVRDTKDAFSTYPKIIKRASIQQQLQGKLKAVTETSWTLETEGQTVTFTSSGSVDKIRYFKFPKNATASAQPVIPLEVRAQDLQIGDTVSISKTVDWQTGASNVGAITIISSK